MNGVILIIAGFVGEIVVAILGIVNMFLSRGFDSGFKRHLLLMAAGVICTGMIIAGAIWAGIDIYNWVISHVH
jgi:hypothetical protein